MGMMLKHHRDNWSRSKREAFEAELAKEAAETTVPAPQEPVAEVSPEPTEPVAEAPRAKVRRKKLRKE